MAAPVPQAITVASGTSATPTADKPTGTGSGELLIAWLTARNNPAVTHDAGTSGFTQIGSTHSNGQESVSCWFLVTGGSEPSTYAFGLSASALFFLRIQRVTGVNVAAPINTSAGSNGSSATTLTCPTVTTTVADTLVYRLAGQTGGSTGDPRTKPTSTEEQANSSTGASGGHWSGVASIVQASAGASGTADWTTSGGTSYGTMTVAIAPAAGGGGTILPHMMQYYA